MQYSEPRPRPSGWRLLVWALLSLMLAAAFGSLGLWQLRRADYKQHLQADAAQAAQAAAVDLAAVANGGTELSERSSIVAAQASGDGEVRYLLPLKVAGRLRLRSDSVLLLDNQIVDGRAGAMVLVVADVEGSAQTLLVNLGWVAWGPAREMPKLRALPVDGVQVRGMLVAPIRAGLRLGAAQAQRSPAPVLINYLDIDALRHSLDPQLLRAVLQLDADLDYGYARQWQAVDPQMPPERHRAYALQWFALALTVLITFLVLALRKRS